MFLVREKRDCVGLLIRGQEIACPLTPGLSVFIDSTLRKVSLYVTEDAIAKLYVT